MTRTTKEQFIDFAGDEPEERITSINVMCEILKKNLIVADEYTDCAIVYRVTFDQLRRLYDQGRGMS